MDEPDIEVLPDAPHEERPNRNSLMLQSFVDDAARRIHTGQEIAVRYGFADAYECRDWINAHAEIRRMIEQRRAVWESEAGLDERLRTLYGHGLLEAYADNARPMFDPTTPVGARVETIRAFARIAGVDGLPPGRDMSPGQQAGRFSVQIVFSGAGKTETITTLEPPAAIEADDESAS